jgi:hypothetical protein
LKADNLRIIELKRELLKGNIQVDEVESKYYFELLANLNWSLPRENLLIKKIVRQAFERGDMKKII